MLTIETAYPKHSIEFGNEVLGEFIGEFTTSKPDDLIVVEAVLRK
jgi:hypothetical protein